MKNTHFGSVVIRILVACAVVATLSPVASAAAGKGPVKVFSQEYERNMPIFIRNVRKELGVPDLPFVIAKRTHR